MAMRNNEKEIKQEDKALKLCSGFSLLDEKDQDNMLGTLQALLFAKLSMETLNEASPQSENEHFG